TRVFKSVRGVNRCVLNLASEPVTTAEPVAATVTRERLDLLRSIDAFVMDALVRHGIDGIVWQCPTVLVPLRLNGRGTELVVVRPVLSERGMTARPADLPRALRGELVAHLRGYPEVSGVVLDLTTKPP